MLGVFVFFEKRMIDYIIVGFGLAGMSFVEQLEQNKRSYVVFEDSSQKSSRVAGGLYNPVILKRFTSSLTISEQLKKAIPFYNKIEERLGKSFVEDLSILRIFNSIEEQNTWFQACDKPILKKFLSTKLYKNHNEGLIVPFHFGKVNCTGRVLVKKMLLTYMEYIHGKELLISESFEHHKLNICNDFVEYKGYKARNIVFAEGYGVTKNPFFGYLPLTGNKGEYIIIKTNKLKLKEAVKSSVFIIPLGNDLYKVGATYNNKDKSSENTEQARKELQEQLERFLNTEYKIIDQEAGIRPTTIDRKPLIGTHFEYKNIHILNGLGSRGIIAAPYLAQVLYRYIEIGEPLEKGIDICRFEKL